MGGRCLIFGGLGAKAAILGTSAGFRVLKNVEPDFVSVKMPADPVSGVDDGKGLFLGSGENHPCFRGGWRDFFKGSIG